MDDIRCTTLLNGDFDRASRYDAERGFKFIKAMINDDPEAGEEVVAQMGDCPNCLRAFACHMGGFASGLMIDSVGRDIAAKVAQHLLDEVLNAPDLLNPPE